MFKKKGLLYTVIFCNILFFGFMLLFLVINSLYINNKSYKEFVDSEYKYISSSKARFLAELKRYDQLAIMLDTSSFFEDEIKKNPDTLIQNKNIFQLKTAIHYVQMINASFPYNANAYIIFNNSDIIINSSGFSTKESLKYLLRQMYFDTYIPKYDEIKEGINIYDSFILYKTKTEGKISLCINIPKSSLKNYLTGSTEDNLPAYTFLNSDNQVIYTTNNQFINAEYTDESVIAGEEEYLCIKTTSSLNEPEITMYSIYNSATIRNKYKSSNRYTLIAMLIFIIFNMLIFIYQYAAHSPMHKYIQSLKIDSKKKETEIEIINNAIEMLKINNMNMEKQISASKKIYMITELVSFISGHSNTISDDLKRQLQSQFPNYVLVTVLCDSSNSTIIQDLESVLNGKHHFLKLSLKQDCIVFMIKTDTYINDIDIKAASSDWQDMGIVGISTVFTDITDLQKAYSETIACIYNSSARDILEHKVVYFSDSLSNTTIGIDISKKANLIISMISHNSTDTLDKALNELLDSMLSISYKNYKRSCEYIMYLYENIATHNSENETKNISDIYSVTQLRSVIYKSFISLSKSISSATLLSNILEYIDKNLSNDLSLVCIADRFGITCEYLSSYFKKNTGVNLSTYITKLRIEKSVKIMKDNPSIKIADLSVMVGYDNVNTFIRQFKQYMGITPAKYKNTDKENTQF